MAPTKRQTEILRMLADGASYAEVAGELEISPATVKQHVHQILERFGARNRREAVEIATEEGWL